ncbi:hypothetical protein QJS04_geneDACA002195 [Acorus gramineus]|uniref:Pullulanase 1, chloroplastic n=1 Tax=Acorus gramineus TaxID=55184 RepID=A0AAV9A7P0_ACOGR|nr:hypothetical protein QJS04_geneDACA002195 [Acorus gramineus]
MSLPHLHHSLSLSPPHLLRCRASHPTVRFPFRGIPNISTSSASLADELSHRPSRSPARKRSVSVRCSLMSADQPPSSVPRSALPKDCLSYSRAYWVTKSLIAWNVDVEDASFHLFASKGANLLITDQSIEGYDVKFQLEFDEKGLPENVTKNFPHIQNYKAFRVPSSLDVGSLLKCQLAISSSHVDGTCSNATGLQLPGILDDLFAYSGPLGAVFVEDAISLYVWAPTAQIETCTVNDPYARGVSDHTVKPEFQGGYLAFTSKDSAGVRHLRELSATGLTHVHLLPSFHFASVDDDKRKWKFVDGDRLATLPPHSEDQQAEVMAIKDEDGYNWGYDPVIWGVPKGSYASDPNGPCRILEFRKMVQSDGAIKFQALNRIGLRVVLDVVYNHLYASGPLGDHSVLDKLVPGYYLRRNTDGFIENSACMNNTASEHFMVERLILDDLLLWAVDYKVDGFRFDLMGHIMRSTMVKAKCALQTLSKDKNGTDGTKIYIYGEGWDFGEVAKNARGVNAAQFNLCGTGIGSFNDRMRDAVLGGSPFGPPLQQGFVTGLSLQVKGSEVLTHDGSPVAYALSPSETVNYVSAHDNETLFDIVSLKTTMEISVDDRCRLNHLATSIVALSQGIPFFHCGDEMLRSKSLDRDSYNSGDWFNRLDFSYESNNWGVGLPPREKNERTWPLIIPRLADPSFKPQKIHILAAVENFKNLLKIRYSSPLFRLRTANAIQERVRFHNSGISLEPGVIVMSIEDGHDGIPGMAQLDPIYSYILVIFNACPTEVSFGLPSLRGRKLQLHPVQLMSSDELVKNSLYESSTGCITIPCRTTTVFVEVRNSGYQ